MMSEPGSITLDREAFKALASEVRVAILKRLEEHRMTVTDLSRAMDLAKPTLLEHLDRLVAAELVKKVDEGRKWIYYDLTKRGRSVLHPHQVKIMISLALAVFLFASGVFAILMAASTAATYKTSFWDPEALGGDRAGFSAFPAGLAAGAPGPWGIILVLLGLVPLILAIWYFRASRDLIDSVSAQLGS